MVASVVFVSLVGRLVGSGTSVEFENVSPVKEKKWERAKIRLMLNKTTKVSDYP